MMHLNSLLSPLCLEGIATALLCGLIIGVERQLSDKPAGIRTSILICLGTYIFVAAGQLFKGENIDASRVLGQIVTGIGFLGAGVILTREGIVVGVTSAAVIWILAGIGSLIGLKRYIPSITLSILTVAVLVGVNLLEKSIVALRKGIYTRLINDKSRKNFDK